VCKAYNSYLYRGNQSCFIQMDNKLLADGRLMQARGGEGRGSGCLLSWEGGGVSRCADLNIGDR